jgi:arylamine N-acetyltransferase
MDTPLLGIFCDYYQLPRSLPKDHLLHEVLIRFSRIPYENLSKIIRSHEGSSAHFFQSPKEVLQGYWSHGTGGTCFPLTQTLVQLIAEIGYTAVPILADRRYGSDTHCAALVTVDGESLLVDPGYLICTPIKIPASGSLEHTTSHSTLLLTRLPGEEKVDLATIEAGRPPRYRLTYKLEPVDDTAFKVAWERSFDWEMMTYPVISSVRGDSHLYIQKKSLTIRSQGRVERTHLTEEELAIEVSRRLSLSPEIVRKALLYLR